MPCEKGEPSGRACGTIGSWLDVTGEPTRHALLLIDKTSLFYGSRIRKSALCVKQILSQHILLRKKVITAVRGFSVLVSSIFVRELRISVIR